MATTSASQLPEWLAEGAPLQLVTFDEQEPEGKRLVVRQDARAKLLKAAGDRPTKVVAVCGLYRTGKSLLLNLLAGTQGAKNGCFAVGDSIRACTAGVWVRASKPTAPDGSVCLLLDCEGTGNTQRDREHDARIFALAVLLSSFLIFNSRSTINEPAVQALALAASLAQHILRQHKDMVPGQSLAPAFLWVVRDFTLALEDALGKPITEQEYLERALAEPTVGPPGGDFSRRADLREAREKILDLFPQRDCKTLVRPVDDEEELQRLSALPLEKFRPKFLKEVEELRSRVLRGCQALHSPSGQVATCGTFLALLEAHVEALNSGSVPKLGDVWQQVAQQECGRALDEALRVFSAKTFEIKASLPLNDEDLRQMLDQGEVAARNKFKEIAMGDKQVHMENEDDLQRGLQDSADRIRKENEEIATKDNEALLRCQFDARVGLGLKEFRLRHDAPGGLSTAGCDEAAQLLKARAVELKAAYDAEAVGPKAARDAPWGDIAVRQLDAAQREIDTWRGRGAAAEEADASAKRVAGEERTRLEAQSGEYQAQVAREIEDSKARTEQRQKERRQEDGEGDVQNWDQSDLVPVDPSKVELREGEPKAARSTSTSGGGAGAAGGKQKQGERDGTGGDAQKKKCCVVL